MTEKLTIPDSDLNKMKKAFALAGVNIKEVAKIGTLNKVSISYKTGQQLVDVGMYFKEVDNTPYIEPIKKKSKTKTINENVKKESNSKKGVR